MLRGRRGAGAGTRTVQVVQRRAAPLEPGVRPRADLADSDLESQAATALFSLSTLSRNVSYQDVKKLVEEVMQSPSLRLHLPVLILHLRNYKKSLAPGYGRKICSTPHYLCFI